MSKKRAAQPESVVVVRTTVEPLHMVVLRAANGDAYLVDRNCALVSRRCASYLRSVDGLVATAAAASMTTATTATMYNNNQHHNSSSSSSAGGASSVVVGSGNSPMNSDMALSCGGGGSGGGSGNTASVTTTTTTTTAGDEAVAAATAAAAAAAARERARAVRVPYCRFDSDADALTSSSALPVVMVSIAQIVEHHVQRRQQQQQQQQARLHSSHAQLPATPPSSRPPTQQQQQQQQQQQSPLVPALSMTPRVPGFVALEGGVGDDGAPHAAATLYPLIDLCDVPAAMLELGIAFMYYKHRADAEPEKRHVCTPQTLGEVDAMRFIAVSALLDMRDVTAPVTLATFDDAQLRRDFHFLRDCERVVCNAARHFPRTATRHTFRALPQPLFALREAARRRGVVCQILSAGMHKRNVNTSYYDVASDTIVWRCEWHFHTYDTDDDTDKDNKCDNNSSSSSRCRDHTAFVVATSWASERYCLRDILRACWATRSPALPCHAISLRYNRADDYVQQQPQQREEHEQQQQQQPQEQAADNIDAQAQHNDDDDNLCDPTGSVADDDDDDTATATAAVDAVARDDVGGSNSDVVNTTPCTPQVLPPPPPCSVDTNKGSDDNNNDDDEAALAARVCAYFDDAAAAAAHADRHDDMGVAVLARAERVGGDVPRYFVLDLDATLHDNLRTLFFVTEFPVLHVVPRSQLARYTLMTAEDKAALRASLRRNSNSSDSKSSAHDDNTFSQQQQQQQREHAQVSSSCKSTVPCRAFAAGHCRRGEACAYWHCARDALPRCRAWAQTGRCARGSRCCFRHDDDNNSAAGGGGGAEATTPRATNARDKSRMRYAHKRPRSSQPPTSAPHRRPQPPPPPY